MGNWRTVRIVGTCAPQEVGALREATTLKRDYSNFGCLSVTTGICGLGPWPADQIDVVGNLAERDYGPDEVAEHLETLAEAAPSLRVKVHCGGEYEDKTCVATVTLEDGKATVGAPEVENVGEISEEQMGRNMFRSLLGQRTA